MRCDLGQGDLQSGGGFDMTICHAATGFGGWHPGLSERVIPCSVSAFRKGGFANCLSVGLNGGRSQRMRFGTKPAKR
jgi:hypothetical protein